MPSINHVKKWEIHPPHQAIQKLLSPELGISPLLAQLLAVRDITTAEEAYTFLSPTLGDLHSPFLMKDMEKAVDRICRAISNREEIVLYGDYDVDGVTGISLLFLFLKELNARVNFFIPNRMEEGYGLHKGVLQQLRDQGAQLVITTDCGITDVDAVRFIQQLGTDVIITDHHEVPSELPPAYAILNPKRRDCNYPFDSLAGVGVVFKLVMALRKTLREQGFFAGASIPNLKRYLDLVALGTIADMVPLTGENRIIAKYGLKELTEGDRVGIKALKDVCGLAGEAITSQLVAFRLAPRINAPGRLSRAARSVELLTTADYDEAHAIALILEQENTQRQQLESRIVREACELFENIPHWKEQKAIVLAAPTWHPGVIGICASRLLDKYSKPVILISCDDEKGIGKGSARSFGSFNLYEGLKECGHLLEAFGGHHSAAGLTLVLDKLEEFRIHFDRAVSEVITEQGYVPSLVIDAEVNLREISENLVREIARLEPFGFGNPEPVFSSPSLDSYSLRVVGNGHLKVKIREDNIYYDAIGFNLAEQFLPLPKDASELAASEKSGMKIAFIPQINEWQGIRSVQLKIKDIKYVE